MLNLNYDDFIKENKIDEKKFVSCKMSCTTFLDLNIYYLRIGVINLDEKEICYFTIDYTDFDLMINTFNLVSKQILEKFKK